MPAGTPGFIGSQLSQARKLRRKNITTLAEEIGLTRASISAYEKDIRTPSPEVIGELCKNLDVPLDFFIATHSEIPELNGPIFYRSYLSASRLARDAAQAKSEILTSIFDYLGQCIDFPASNIPKFDVPSDPTALDEADIEKIAEKTRTFWGLSLGPISDLVCLLENNGIVIGKFPFKCKELDAFSQRRGGQFQIIVGSDKGSCVRQRFDVAHELGHILLHWKVPEEFIKDKTFLKVIERQANFFAFEFLFPSKAFQTELKKVSLNEFIRLKRRWKVSIAAQLQKASGLSIASPSEIAPLHRALSRNGWRTEEPFDDELACEEPRLFKDAFEMLLDSGVQTSKDISSQINLHFSDIEEVAGLPDGYLSSFNKTSILQLKKEFQVSTESSEKDGAGLEETNLQCVPSVSGKKASTVVSFMDAFAHRK